jgi:Tol biopolymer transport system component
MSLTPGTRLGPFEILSLIGSGGMGEVYRAADTRLDRILALKILPERLADDPVRRQRFEREARAVASLNHPHICGLYDIGQDRGIDFLVLEYLEGRTLAGCLIKGALPLSEVMKIGVQLADALDHAHRCGLVHRDLKPGNIMLTRSGVKVLDFGLAKLRVVDSLPELSTVATAGSPLTGENALLGTFEYMAPEQLEGRDADARTDIFALGAIIYEMAAGNRPFERNTQAGIIGAILHTDPPPIASLRPLIPPALDRVVSRCLAKDPDDRWQSARDLMLELKWIADGAAGPAVAPVPDRGKWSVRAGWAAAAVLALSMAVVSFVHFREVPLDRRVVRLSMLPGRTTSYFSLSPDGRLLTFAGGNENDTRLWIHSLDSVTPQPLRGTEGAGPPFWSPDGRFIAFGAGGKLKKIAVSGGPVQTICDAPGVVGGTWNRDDVIVFAPGNRTPLHRVSAAGGESTPVTTLDQSQSQNTHRWPHFLPDGRHFVFLSRSTRVENNGVYLATLDSKAMTRLMSADSMASFVNTGYLLFVRDGALLARAYDPGTQRLGDDLYQILDDVRYSMADGAASFSVSEGGEMAYQSSAAVAQSELVWFNRAGERIGSPAVTGNVEEPSISLDGTRLAVMRWANGTSDVWQIDLARNSSLRLTTDPAIDFAPLWSPDSSAIVFSSNRDGPSDLYQTMPGGEDKSLLRSASVKHATHWSPDGRFIIYQTVERSTGRDLWTLADGDQKREVYLQTAFHESLGRLSPNGRWMAYVSNQTGRDEVYVRPFPPSTGMWRISTEGGTEPRWRRDGRELFYIAADQNVMAVPVESGTARFQSGIPGALFKSRSSHGGIWSYDVTPDGQRFVMSVNVGDPVPPIIVVLNWTMWLPHSRGPKSLVVFRE